VRHLVDTVTGLAGRGIGVSQPAGAGRHHPRGKRVTAQAVGAAIGALHHRGLIERTPDPRDRRKTIISLTDPSRSAFTVREQTVIDRMVQSVASGYAPAERRQLATAAPLLERLADLLWPPRP
jgi:hypothetical protein